MIHDEFPGVALHNVVETTDPAWTDGGHRLRRIPASVGERLNVDACETDNVHLVDGPELMDATGLTTDLLHPGDTGMEVIGTGLAEAVGSVIEE